MPLFIALLGALAAGFFWMNRMRNAAETTQELAGMAGDVMAAARRFGFHRRSNTHPVTSIDDPNLAIGALGLAFLELGGLPSSDQHDALIVALQRHTGQSLKEAEERLILGRWLITECARPLPAITRLAQRLAKIDAKGSFAPLMAVLNDVAASGRNGGAVSDRQKDALGDIARAFKLG